ncbi:MAG: WYL domain-containing protein [Planctomycetaceae bacterium]
MPNDNDQDSNSRGKKKKSDAERRIQQAARLADILKMLNLLRGYGRWNAAGLAREFECNERTVRRNLKVLEYAGIPIFYNRKERCYYLRSDYSFPVLNLNPEEMLGQAIATVTTKAIGLDISEGAEPTTINLAATNEEMQEILAQAGELVEVLGLQLADHSQHQEIIRTVQQALLNGKQIRGLYRSPYRDKDFELQIEPYRLCLIKQAWYIVGRGEGMPKPHTYRIARFKSLKMLELNASIPEDFTLDEYLETPGPCFGESPVMKSNSCSNRKRPCSLQKPAGTPPRRSNGIRMVPQRSSSLSMVWMKS